MMLLVVAVVQVLALSGPDRASAFWGDDRVAIYSPDPGDPSSAWTFETQEGSEPGSCITDQWSTLFNLGTDGDDGRLLGEYSGDAYDQNGGPFPATLNVDATRNTSTNRWAGTARVRIPGCTYDTGSFAFNARCQETPAELNFRCAPELKTPDDPSPLAPKPVCHSVLADYRAGPLQRPERSFLGVDIFLSWCATKDSVSVKPPGYKARIHALTYWRRLMMWLGKEGGYKWKFRKARATPSYAVTRLRDGKVQLVFTPGKFQICASLLAIASNTPIGAAGKTLRRLLRRGYKHLPRSLKKVLKKLIKAFRKRVKRRVNTYLRNKKAQWRRSYEKDLRGEGYTKAEARRKSKADADKYFGRLKRVLDELLNQFVGNVLSGKGGKKLNPCKTMWTPRMGVMLSPERVAPAVTWRFSDGGGTSPLFDTYRNLPKNNNTTL